MKNAWILILGGAASCALLPACTSGLVSIGAHDGGDMGSGDASPLDDALEPADAARDQYNAPDAPEADVYASEAGPSACVPSITCPPVAWCASDQVMVSQYSSGCVVTECLAPEGDAGPNGPTSPEGGALDDAAIGEAGVNDAAAGDAALGAAVLDGAAAVDAGRSSNGTCPLIPPSNPCNPPSGCSLVGRWHLSNSHGTVQSQGVIEFDPDGAYYGGPTGTNLGQTYAYDGQYSATASTFQLVYSCGDGTCVGSGNFDVQFQSNCQVAILNERTTECTGDRTSVAGTVILTRQ